MEWKNKPPAPTEFAGVRLIRVATGKDFEGIITSNGLVGHDTHWWKRRTVPCTSPDCAACCDGTPARWHGYISVYCTRNHAHYVLEMTSLAAAAVDDFAERHGDLRGSLIRAARQGNRPNSPVAIAVYAHDSDLRTLPRAINLEHFLETIWSLKPNRDDPGEKPPAGQNIRNTLLSDPPTSSSEPLQLSRHPLSIEKAKSNGKGPK